MPRYLRGRAVAVRLEMVSAKIPESVARRMVFVEQPIYSVEDRQLDPNTAEVEDLGMANAKIPGSAAQNLVGAILQRIIAEAQQGQLKTVLMHPAVLEMLEMVSAKGSAARSMDGAALPWDIVEQMYRRLQKTQL
jgi:hypothetical protein